MVRKGPPFVIEFIFLLLFGVQANVSAQTKELDSLLLKLKTGKEDSDKVKIHARIAFIYYTVDAMKGEVFARKGIDMAKKIGFKKGEGTNWNALGINLQVKGKLPDALKAFQNALHIFEALHDSGKLAMTMHNVGSIYQDLSKVDLALSYYKSAMEINTRMNNSRWLVSNILNIGSLQYSMHEFEEAMLYFRKTVALATKDSMPDMVALALGNIGGIYGEQDNWDSAKHYMNKSLRIYKELNEPAGITRLTSSLGSFYYRLATRATEDIRNRICTCSVKEALDKSMELFKEAIRIDLEIGDLSAYSHDCGEISKVYESLGETNKAFEYYKLYSTSKDSIYNLDQRKKITELGMQYEFDKKELKAKAIQEKKDIRERNIRNAILSGLIIALIFLSVVIFQRNRIKMEKKRSEELLLNILPEEVADELKAKGEAEARLIDEVSVLFTDFKGFTAISETLSPKELVRDLHECFTAFDRIIAKHGMEKIKTIGDAYMAAGGLPVANHTHANDAVSAALEIRAFIEKGRQEKIAAGKPYFEIRIGIHTGPVVAGIVGVKKFSYDIWGDTVNTASRMESSGEAGKVNISETTYNLVKENFVCTTRGKIAAKGKEAMEMYFVEGPVQPS